MEGETCDEAVGLMPRWLEPVGRPRTRWVDQVSEDGERLGVPDWRLAVQGRADGGGLGLVGRLSRTLLLALVRSACNMSRSLKPSRAYHTRDKRLLSELTDLVVRSNTQTPGIRVSFRS